MEIHEHTTEKSNRPPLTLELMGTETLYETANGLLVFIAPKDLGAFDKLDDALNASSVREREMRLPYTGLGYALPETGVLSDAFHAFNIKRLFKIFQLSKLSDPDHNPELIFSIDPFIHSRGLHTFDVLALASVTGRNLNLSSNEMLLLQTAALTHDALTPAGGDTTKLIDRHALDEDEHYPTLFMQPEVNKFCKENGVAKELLVETIMNRGLLGEILNFSDKLAYTCRDVNRFIGSSQAATEWDERVPARRAVTDYLAEMGEEEPRLDVWETLIVSNGRLVCTYPHRLYAFLKLRALMFRELYSNPKARCNESLLYSIYLQYLYETGQVKREALLDADTGTDQDLDALIHGAFDINLSTFLQHTFKPTYKTFSSEEEARAFVQELVGEGKVMVRYENAAMFFKPGTNFLVRNKEGAIGTFSALCPQETEDIVESGAARNPIRVYYMEKETLPDTNEMRMFREWRRKKGVAL